MIRESSETVRQALNGMRQSDLHGDMQSQTETIWPSEKLLRVTEINGPKVNDIASLG